MKFPLFRQSSRIATSLAVLGVALAVDAQESADVAPYLLSTCPVSGSELGAMDEPVSKIYEGKVIKFCCGGCPAKYEADRAKYDAQIEASLITSQTPYNPLDTCVVNGEKLGTMGKPVDHIDGSTLVRLCCKGCVAKFQKNRNEYVKSLNQTVVEKQKGHYPFDTCVVSGNKLGGDMGEPIDYVVGNRLIRLCCQECIKDVAKDPAKYLKLLGDGQHVDAGKGEGHSDGHHDQKPVHAGHN